MAIVEDVAKASGKARGNLKNPVALERAGQGLGSLLVVARGVRSALREPLPVAPHVQAPVWSVAHLGHPAYVSGIVSSATDNVNATNTEYAPGSEHFVLDSFLGAGPAKVEHVAENTSLTVPPTAGHAFSARNATNVDSGTDRPLGGASSY